jgi:Arc/MetJ-type ribon-helix-helix transcriptional regulator
MQEYEDDQRVGRVNRDGTERVTVSLPAGTAAVLRDLVDQGKARSVSQLLADAVAPVVRAHQHRERTLAWLMEHRDGRPIPEEALAYWRDKLAGETAGPQSGAA